MEKYYKVKKEYAMRGGFDESTREEIGDYLVLSERDLRMISVTIEEKLAVIGAVEYVAGEVESENDEEDGGN